MSKTETIRKLFCELNSAGKEYLVLDLVRHFLSENPERGAYVQNQIQDQIYQQIIDHTPQRSQRLGELSAKALGVSDPEEAKKIIAESKAHAKKKSSPKRGARDFLLIDDLTPDEELLLQITDEEAEIERQQREERSREIEKQWAAQVATCNAILENVETLIKSKKDLVKLDAAALCLQKSKSQISRDVTNGKLPSNGKRGKGALRVQASALVKQSLAKAKLIGRKINSKRILDHIEALFRCI